MHVNIYVYLYVYKYLYIHVYIYIYILTDFTCAVADRPGSALTATSTVIAVSMLPRKLHSASYTACARGSVLMIYHST